MTSKIEIIPVDRNYFARPNVKAFINIVYNNFFDISGKPELLHTPKEIYRLLNSVRFRGLLAKIGKKIIGYLLGEVHLLADGRKVFFINYLYVGRAFRKQGVASRMMDIITMIGKRMDVDVLMLNCDTENKKVFDFYSKRGFMLDLVLRRYSRYDVMSVRV